MLNVSILESSDQLHALARDWDSLECTSPFRQPFWLLNWWDTVRPSGTPFVVIVTNEAGDLVGLLPLYRKTDVYEGACLRSMGDLSACTDYFSITVRPGFEANVAAAIATELVRQVNDPVRHWGCLLLDGVSQSDSTLRQLLTELDDRGASHHAQSRMSFWRLNTDRTWNEWCSELSRSHRRIQRNRLKAAEQWPGAIHRVPQCPAEVDLLAQQVIDLHQARWQAAGQPGSFATEQATKFFLNACHSAYEINQLYLVVTELNGKPAAGEVGFIGRDGVLYLYCVGRDPSLEREEVGLRRTALTQAEAMRGPLKAIDYLRGDEQYKQRCRAAGTPCLQIRVAAPGLKSRLRHAMWLTSFEMTQLLRRSAGRPTVKEITNLVGTPH